MNRDQPSASDYVTNRDYSNRRVLKHLEL
jgi:hypothetical protein